MTRSQEKWKPIGLEGANSKALDPQGINRTIFKLISQMARTRVQGIGGQWSNKEPYVTKSNKKAKIILQTEKRSVPFSDYFRRPNII